MKDDAAIVVLLAGGFEIEVGYGDAARVSGRQVEERCADDGVVSNFQFVTVSEDEKRRRLRRLGFCSSVIGILNGVGRRDILHWRDV